MKDPAFLFYPNDFIVGTAFMTNEVVGAYIRLLCYQADKGVIPEEHMMMICQSREVRDSVACKFTLDEHGGYYNVRLRQEKEKRSAYAESRRNNRKSKLDDDNTSSSYDPHMVNENENVNRNTVIKKTKPAGEASSPKFPEIVIGLFAECYSSIIGHEYIVTNAGQHRKMSGALLKIYRDMQPDSDSDKCLDDLRILFRACISAAPTARTEYLQSITFPKLVSSINDYLTLARRKNGSAKTSASVTDTDSSILADLAGV